MEEPGCINKGSYSNCSQARPSQVGNGSTVLLDNPFLYGPENWVQTGGSQFFQNSEAELPIICS